MNKNQFETQPVRFSTLENPVESNSFALLRFLVSIIGKNHSRTVIKLIADNNRDSLSAARLNLYTALKEKYPSLAPLTGAEIESKLIGYYKQADIIINQLVKDTYEDMEFELGLLDSTSVSTPDLVLRIKQYIYNSQTTPRFKYELIRQDILAFILFELEEFNHERETRIQLSKLQAIFEKELYLGRTGEISSKIFYSVHNNTDNKCIASFSTKRKAKTYVKKQKQETHIKSHHWRTRTVDKVGPVLSNMRVKSDYSIIRKAIFISSLEKKAKTKSINISNEGILVDKAGFMFVTDNGKRETLMNTIIEIIKVQYPNVKIVKKDLVGKTSKRNQSSKVNFTRIIAYLDGQSQPIEIIVMNQDNYLDYRLEFDQAHEIFDIKKSVAAADLLFPNNIFEIKKKDIKKIRANKINKIKTKLGNKKNLKDKSNA